MKIHLTEKQKAVIEKYGVFSERNGLSPAQSRIVGLLLVCEAGELTFEEIYSTLNLSKSAVSNALNSLLIMSRVEYHTKSGDRKRYFFVNPSRSASDSDTILKKLSDTSEIYQEILACRSKINVKYNADLKRSIEFNNFIQKEFAVVFRKWKNKK